MEGDEIIFGKNAVLAFLESEGEQVEAAFEQSKVKINKILLAAGGRPDPRIDRIQSMARQHRIPINTCERKKLDQLCGPERRHQGVVALVSPAEMWKLETFLQKLE